MPGALTESSPGFLVSSCLLKQEQRTAKGDEIHALYNLFCWDFRKPPVRGETGKQECRQYQITSSDNGETWAESRDITDQIVVNVYSYIAEQHEGRSLAHIMREVTAYQTAFVARQQNGSG